MSRITKKKFVVEEVLNCFDLPTTDQKIVKVLRGCGNNLHEVLTTEGNKFLVSMPTKFRKHIWIKRGDFIVIDPIEEGVKVKGEIAKILYKEQIKYYKEQDVWPKEFDETDTEKRERHSSGSDNELFVNTNRPCMDSDESASSDSESASSDNEIS